MLDCSATYPLSSSSDPFFVFLLVGKSILVCCRLCTSCPLASARPVPIIGPDPDPELSRRNNPITDLACLGFDKPPVFSCFVVVRFRIMCVGVLLSSACCFEYVIFYSWFVRSDSRMWEFAGEFSKYFLILHDHYIERTYMEGKKK